MSRLAIKGHATRGKEVIELLEMLGGLNKLELKGYPFGETMEQNYVIDNGVIMPFGFDKNRTEFHGWMVFTLEKFLEKFPYKVGDKVKIYDYYKYPVEITGMKWNGSAVIYKTFVENQEEWHDAEDLQSYKEEPMEEKVKSIEILENYCENEVAIEFDPSKYKMQERDGKYFVVKKGSQYPETYEECCDVLGIEYPHIELNENTYSASCYKNGLIAKFIYLLICRDAYWKLAGDWKPNWIGGENFALSVCKNGIRTAMYQYEQKVLAFPTAEMRDAFYENFKGLIEECKELL